jgi:hypothetical protein
MPHRTSETTDGSRQSEPSNRAASTDQVVTGVPTPHEVREAYYEELGPCERSVLWSWLAFTVTFGIVRGITYSIKDGVGPFHNVTTKGGGHLHHYLWGIALVSGVGSVAVRGDASDSSHPLVGVAYGTGMALIVDEFALLIDLKDVYWAKQGRWSVDLAVGLISATGSALAAAPVLSRLRRNRGR